MKANSLQRKQTCFCVGVLNGGKPPLVVHFQKYQLLRYCKQYQFFHCFAYLIFIFTLRKKGYILSAGFDQLQQWMLFASDIQSQILQKNNYLHFVFVGVTAQLERPIIEISWIENQKRRVTMTSLMNTFSPLLSRLLKILPFCLLQMSSEHSESKMKTP